MSYPPPSGYPGAAPQQQPVRRRGRRAIQVGIVLLILAVAAFVAGGIVLATKSLTKVSGFQRVSVAQATGTIHFDHAGGYVAYYEASDVDNDIKVIPPVQVVLQGSSGGPMVLTTPYGGRSDHKIKKFTYAYDGHHGAALYQFHIDQPGTYQVVLQATPGTASDATIAFGVSIAAGTVAGALLILLGVLLLIAGAVTLIIGLVKRSRHGRQLAAGGYYPGGGYYPPPGYPGQQFPPQQYPQQQYPAAQQQYPGQQQVPPQQPPQQEWPPPANQDWPPKQ